MNLATWHSKRIRGFARTGLVAQGENATLTLLKHDDNANNGTNIDFDPPLVFVAGTWTKVPVAPDFDGRNDGDVVFTEELQLPEGALIAAQANEVLAVRIGDDIKRVRLTVPPNGLQRYWRFEIVPT